ncbi:MAG TPA: DUF4375 domain-containing protein [Verrucomicrobiota bacterium]|nr:hypothetical protein [Verrucomicrobiales bacterium]HRI16334.1 DUF4375 domain-containing protein [Verrucomicrobiota bacterium]
MPSKTSYWDRIESAYEEVDIYESYEVFRTGASKFPEWQIDLLATHWTLSEILNGGLLQYFGNSTAVLAPEAILGFRRIGVPEASTALQSAMDLFGAPYPREHDDRTKRLATLTGKPTDVGSGESFSFIPKWVRDSAGIKSSADTSDPFATFDPEFISREEALYAAMDHYAESHSAA